MGKLLLSALLGGILGSVLTFFLLSTLAPGERRAEMESRLQGAEESAKSAADTTEVLAKRLEFVAKRLDSATREHAKAVGRIEASLGERSPSDDGDFTPAAGGAPDGTPYVSRAEMEAAIAKARSSGALAVHPGPAAEPPKSVEEIARDMNLSASDEAAVRNLLKESEEELARCLFGDRPLADVAAEVKAAQDDPDKLQDVIGGAVANAFSNIGKLMTLEKRTKKKVEGVLGKERAKDFLGRPHKPVLGDEFQKIFEGVDLD